MILVTGAAGQIGFDVCHELQERGLPYIGQSSADCDLADRAQVMESVLLYKPDVVIHCGAYTKVDQAEEEKRLAYQVNVEGTANVVAACKQAGAKMLYLSTDYVFSGEGNSFYEIDAPKGPLNYYGETKLQGEQIVSAQLDKGFIVRTSWVFGIHGNNFVKTMLKLSMAHQKVSVVCDQVGSPTYSKDLANMLCDLVLTEQYGFYHATNEGICSWAEFADEIFRQSGKKREVLPLLSCEYPRKATRPLNSRLSKRSLDEAGFSRLPHWKDALKRYLKEFANDEKKGDEYTANF